MHRKVGEIPYQINDIIQSPRKIQWHIRNARFKSMWCDWRVLNNNDVIYSLSKKVVANSSSVRFSTITRVFMTLSMTQGQWFEEKKADL